MPVDYYALEDSYSLVQEAFMKRIRTNMKQTFAMEYQVAADDTVIAKGADNFIVVRPGAFPFTPADMHEKDFRWGITFDLFVRYKEYKTSWAQFRVIRAALINLMFSDPSLDSTKGVWNVSIFSNESAQYFTLEDKPTVKPNFIIQTMNAEITQRVKFEF